MDYVRKAVKTGDIGRRYLVVNSFDGVLTVLGIVMGSLISEVSSPLIVLNSGLGASLALGISGFSSAYLSEKAERRKDIRDMKDEMRKEVSDSFKEKQLNKVPFKVSLVNGLSPFITGLVCVSPFALSVSKFFSVDLAYPASIVISLSALIFLGYFLGSVSRKNKVISGLKMLMVGIATVIILYLLGLGGF